MNIRSGRVRIHTQLSWSDYVVKYGVYAAFFLLLLVNAIITPNFVSINIVWNIAIQSATILLISLGMTICISGGGINLAVGSIMALSSVMVAWTLQMTGSIFLSVLATIIVASFTGFLIGVIIAVFKIQAMIVTLAFMTMLRGIAMLFPNTGRINILNEGFLQIAIYRIGGVVPIQIVMIIISIIVITILLRKMSFGRYVEAIGDNASAARYAGVNTTQITILMYVFCSILAGLAGVLESARIAASNALDVGKMVEMDAVASTVIGGTPLIGGKANILGTMVGVFIMQLITIMVNMNNVPYEYSLIIKAAIILLAVYIQKFSKR